MGVILITTYMGKILTVKTPFFVLEEGDKFELSEDGKSYVSTYTEEHDVQSDDKSASVKSSYKSSYTIPVSYAKELIDNGFLVDTPAETPFVNVFDEIETLLRKYNSEIEDIDYINNNDTPKTVLAEKETVLTNLVTLLNHLKSLKK